MLSINDFSNEDALARTEIASRYGRGIDKKIIIETNILKLDSKFIVYDAKEIKYYGSDIETAIAAYNNIDGDF